MEKWIGQTVVLELARGSRAALESSRYDRDICEECIFAREMDMSLGQQFTLEQASGPAFYLKTHDGYFVTISRAHNDAEVFKCRPNDSDMEKQQWIFEECPPSRRQTPDDGYEVGFFIVSAYNPLYALDVQYHADKHEWELQMYKKYDLGKRNGKFENGADNQVFYIHRHDTSAPRVIKPKRPFIMQKIGQSFSKGYCLATRADVEGRMEEVKDAVGSYSAYGIELKDGYLWPGERWAWRIEDTPASRPEVKYQLLVVKTNDDQDFQWRVVEDDDFSWIDCPDAFLSRFALKIASVAEARRYIREVREVADRPEYFGIPIELKDGLFLNGVIQLNKFPTEYKLQLFRW